MPGEQNCILCVCANDKLFSSLLPPLFCFHFNSPQHTPCLEKCTQRCCCCIVVLSCRIRHTKRAAAATQTSQHNFLSHALTERNVHISEAVWWKLNGMFFFYLKTFHKKSRERKNFQVFLLLHSVNFRLSWEGKKIEKKEAAAAAAAAERGKKEVFYCHKSLRLWICSHVECELNWVDAFWSSRSLSCDCWSWVAAFYRRKMCMLS
jgi:hypothetical protein